MFSQKLVDLYSKNYEWLQDIWSEIQGNWIVCLIQFVVLFLIIYNILCNLYQRSLRALLTTLTVFLSISILILYFHLNELELIFSQLWLVLGFIFIVAFQAELRRVLDKIGGFGYDFTLEMNTIRTVADAAMDMGPQKTGAIMVLERKISIDGYIYGTKSTEMLNANMSRKLLENIFIKNSPLHDMAVVIRDNKILAARVLLPLTFEKRMDFGTRHSAGVGISTRSDAVAVVVSEERGTVTVFFDGHKRLCLELGPTGDFTAEQKVELVNCLKKYVDDMEMKKMSLVRKAWNKVFNVKEKEEAKDE